MILPFYRNKKVFITGHTGFKGSWLCRILLMSGADVTGYALLPETHPSLFGLLKIKKDIRSIIGDVRNYDLFLKSIKSAKPDFIFHLAAQPLVRESYKRPLYTYETNVIGTVHLLEACRYLPSVKSIINVTTDKVYENREEDRAFKEQEKLCGHDPYSNSKSCSDIITYSYRNAFFCEKDSPALSTARAGNVIGGGDFAADRIIPDCVRAVQKNKPIVIRNPESTRPYQHVLDCLSGYLLLAQKQYNNKNIQGSYNFGPEKRDLVNNETLVKMFCDRWGEGVTSIHKKDKGPHEAKFLKLDISKAKNNLKWKPQRNVKQAVDLTVEWSKAYLTGGNIFDCIDRQIKEYF